MQRQDRLSVLMCWVLAIAGACYSTGAAAVGWLSRPNATRQQVQTAIEWGTRLGIRQSQNWLRLADWDPEHEEEYLRRAVQSDPRSEQALLRLSLSREFAADRREARHWMEAALSSHRSYPTYMAALSQASRWGEVEQMEQFAVAALRYCPRDADGVYAQLANLDVARRVLAATDKDRREDFLRYLVAQQRDGDAWTFAAGLPHTGAMDNRRLELVELLWRKGRQQDAATLFGQIHPEFAATGTFNTRLRSRPTAMGFDWRLTNHPKAHLDWRPGELRIGVEPTAVEIELLTTYIQVGERAPERVSPLWTGDTTGMIWRIEPISAAWRRVSLVAKAGAERRLALAEVRFE